MKLCEFVEELAKMRKKKFKAIVDEDGVITLTKRGHRFCPLTAVAYVKTKMRWGFTHYDLAASALKINKQVADNIISAADDEFLDVGTSVFKLREKLLKALKLDKKL